MKKILLGTTALIAMGLVSSQASAADKISLGLGGFMSQYVAFTDTDGSTVAGSPDAQNDAVSTFGNSEVYFSGSTTLDNGLAVGVMVQREADKGNGGNTDVSALTISSDSMGQLLLGGDSGAVAKLQNTAPIVGPKAIGDMSRYSANAVAAINTEGSGNKFNKIRYISPSFGGVSVAASFQPSGTNNDEVVAGGSASTTELAVAYSGEFSGVGVSADLGREQQQQAVQITRGGLVLTMAGFSVGGSYAKHSDDDVGNTATSTTNDARVYDLGVGYATGPYSFAVTYSNAEAEGTTAVAANDESETWSVGGAYDMGAGVSLVGQYGKGKYQNEAKSLTTDNNGSAFIAGIEVSF